jgi:hypothetical protein
VGIGQDDDIAPANVEKALEMGVPLIETAPPHGRPLAIVGGGPSFLDRLDELRKWPDIWAINGAARELRDCGIESVAVSVDPNAEQWEQFDGVGEGLFASCCTAKIFEMYAGRCRMFHLDTVDGEGIRAQGGPTTAARMHYAAFNLGYGEIHYFGCESSYEGGTHAYDYTDPGPDLVIEADGKRYPTKPYLVLQAEYLSELMREFPQVFKNRSGGLLGAMIERPDTWGIVEAADELQQYLKPYDKEGSTP